MHRSIKLLIVSFLLIVTSYDSAVGPSSSMTSYLPIVKKGHSKDYKKAWIIAFDPNSKVKKEIKIIIKEPMVWNLIEANQTYFTSYSIYGNNPCVLEQIEHIGDNDTLR
ncbi:hypothetical protein [Neobacillus terrae]|uniref:hypothetical protein n=1 Tax=Neobacillus terrae TaxID=3034837 RepID=UPI00140CE94B|nr:hypothetical protein [Neobacillus terrae]NHM32039.1 hypothetical protein [Neobacillus terrae]